MKKKKLIDILADIEVNDLECDLIQGNIGRWVNNKLTDKIADASFRQYQKSLHNTPEMQIDINKLKERVLDKLAERIIDDYLEGEK